MHCERVKNEAEGCVLVRSVEYSGEQEMDEMVKSAAEEVSERGLCQSWMKKSAEGFY